MKGRCLFNEFTAIINIIPAPQTYGITRAFEITPSSKVERIEDYKYSLSKRCCWWLRVSMAVETGTGSLHMKTTQTHPGKKLELQLAEAKSCVLLPIVGRALWRCSAFAIFHLQWRWNQKQWLHLRLEEIFNFTWSQQSRFLCYFLRRHYFSPL